MYYELGGLYQQQQQAFLGLMVVIVAAFLLVFALLLYLYESYDVAVSIILMPLFAMPAVFIGLWVTGTELNITALMGMTMVVGIVTEVAIFYFSEYGMLLAEGRPEQEARLLEAGANRFRPIAMTTAAAILALLPLALPFALGRRRDAAAAGHRHHRGTAGSDAAGVDRHADFGIRPVAVSPDGLSDSHKFNEARAASAEGALRDL